MKIISSDKSPFAYKIPGFKVIEVQLMKVKFTKDGEVCNGLVNADQHPNLKPGIYTCTSYCEEATYEATSYLEKATYVVLWLLHSYKPFPNSAQVENDTGTSNENEEEMHSLPFKVVGTCYSPARQKVLEEAYECLNTYNRLVFAKLVPEPENPMDKNAIAVYVLTDNEYEKVGYIPKERISYLHGPLSKRTLDVTVENVRFRTTYLLIGYYITLNISKKGAWDNVVVRASLKVD